MAESGRRSPESVPHSDTPGPRPAGTHRLSGRRLWLARLALVVLAPALVLACAEGALRLAGYGYSPHFFAGPDTAGNYTPNDAFGLRFFPPGIVREPTACLLAARKPAGTIRIFVLGSSAAEGTPDPAYSFGRILEVMLRERYPGLRFQIVNAAMTAINSHAVREIARDCASLEPDLFIIYMGNNEVVGPFGPGTILDPYSGSLAAIRAGVWVKSMRLGQLFRDAAGALAPRPEAPTEWKGMQMWMAGRVAADDPRLEAVYSHFRRNLQDVCRTARAAGAATIVSTVAVNLRDCPPLASVHRAGLDEAALAQWEAEYAAGAILEAQGHWEDALASYRAAAAIDDAYAELHFRMARRLAAAGRKAEALEHYVRARDLDALRFRADSRINEIIREVAGPAGAGGVEFLDAEHAFAEADPTGIGAPGEEAFHEHVHLKFAGNYRLARMLLGKVEAALAGRLAGQTAAAIPGEQRCAARLAFGAYDRYRVALHVWRMTEYPPFTNQLDHAFRHATAFQNVVALRRAAYEPGAMDEDARLYEAAIAAAPDDTHLHKNFAELEAERGRFESALAHRRTVIAQFPHHAGFYIDAGDMLMRCGKPAEAQAHFAEALRLRPQDADARKGLGDAILAQQEHEDAAGRP
jgi:tetratricopeptide (TPR) repeat protein